MNIIIVGCGRVGRSIAEQLNTEGHSIIVIDENPEALERIFHREDVPGFIVYDCNHSTPLLEGRS